MTKKRSRGLFVVFAILLVICLIASFVNFTLPFNWFDGNYYSYSNFVSNIRLGQDISDGLKIVYRTEVPNGKSSTDYDILLESTISDLKSIIQGLGHKDVTVTSYGDDRLTVQIGNIISRDEKDNLISLVGDPATVSFSMSDDVTAAFAFADDVKSVEVYENKQTTPATYYVKINFKDKDKIAEATKAGGSVYIFFGDTQFTYITMDDGITDGVIAFTGNNEDGSPWDKSTANIYVNKIKTGMLALELTKIESVDITPSYGIGADVLLAVAMFIVMLAGFAFLIVKYKHLGWLACFNLLFYVVIGLFLIQSIPFMHVNFAGILSMMLCFIIAIDTLIAIFEKAKKHTQADTKLYIALKMSQKENVFRTVITNLLFTIVGFVCIFIPNMAIQSFGMVAFVLSLVNLFTSLVLMRLFINMYLPFNSNNVKKCNFHKGGKYVK